MRKIRTAPPRLPARDAVFADSVRAARELGADVPYEARSLTLPPIETDPFGPYVDFVELILDDGLDEHDRALHAEELRRTEAVLLAMLADVSQAAAVPEHIMMQIAYGEAVGLRNARCIARLLARARQRGMTADDYIADAAAADELGNDNVRRLFHGETGRVPDHGRVRRGIDTVLRAAAHVEPADRPALLCIAAWLQWIDGRRAAALTFVHEAQRIEPTHLLAYGLNHLISTTTPRWLREQ